MIAAVSEDEVSGLDIRLPVWDERAFGHHGSRVPIRPLWIRAVKLVCAEAVSCPEQPGHKRAAVGAGGNFLVDWADVAINAVPTLLASGHWWARAVVAGGLSIYSIAEPDGLANQTQR
jgi:hypothetical protein